MNNLETHAQYLVVWSYRLYGLYKKIQQYLILQNRACCLENVPSNLINHAFSLMYLLLDLCVALLLENHALSCCTKIYLETHAN